MSRFDIGRIKGPVRRLGVKKVAERLGKQEKLGKEQASVYKTGEDRSIERHIKSKTGISAIQDQL